LRFENDEEAEYFIGWAKFQSNVVGRATVEMMVQTPTLFCDCAYRGDGWRRGEKRGWWVHVGCGKPSVGWGENPRAVISEATDYLEQPTKQNTQERLQEIDHEGV